MESARKIRLLFVSSMFKHDFRFMEQFNKHRDVLDVEVVTFSEQAAKNLKPHGIPVHNLNPEKWPFDDWDRKGAYSFFQKLRLKTYFRRLQKRYRQFLLQFKPDVVHSGWLQTDSHIATLEKISPVIVKEWGTDILIRPFDNEENLKKTRSILQAADLILCDCKIADEKTKEVLQSEDYELLQFPCGIDLKKFQPNKTPRTLKEPIRFIMAKNLIPVSDFDTLIKATQKLMALPTKEFVIDVYGDGPGENEIKQQAVDANVGSVLKFHDRVANDRIPEIFRMSHFYLSCNLSEGTSLALMEAMACGLVPICTELPSYQEWISPEENGTLFTPKSVDQLCEKMLWAMNLDPNTYTDLELTNIGLAKREFNWDDNFAKLLAGYKRLAGVH